MKGLTSGLIILAYISFFSGDRILNAQTVKGQNLRTHSIRLSKKKVKNDTSDSIPLIGFLSLHPYIESSEMIKNAYDFLRTGNENRVEFICYKDLRKKVKSMNRYSAIWIHRPDTTDLSSEETNHGLLLALRSYIEHGGKLLLTQQAFHYINKLGLESELPQDSTKRCIDDGDGRRLGVHAFRDHPLFNQLNGGAYLLRPHRDITTRISGFFGKNKPAKGKVVAVDWDYFFIREESILILEYTLGAGTVIAVGGYIDFTEGNINRQHLELFIKNSFRYLTGKAEERRK